MRDKKISQALQIACLIEASSPKPGNVYPGRSFSDLNYRDFLFSAAAVAPAFINLEEKNIGEIILEAVINTHQYIDSNTNLGIIMLCAPLAKTYHIIKKKFKLKNLENKDILKLLKAELNIILKNLSIEDSKAAYKAINLSKAGNLSKVDNADIKEEVDINLFEAMKLAEKRDMIAYEYVNGYEITLGFSYPRLEKNNLKFNEIESAVVQTYLEILASYHDSLIIRKHGEKKAEEISNKAEKIIKAGALKSLQGRDLIKKFDKEMRERKVKINPGTTADLVTAALFLSILIGGPEIVKMWSKKSELE